MFEVQTAKRGKQTWDLKEKRELPPTHFRHKLVCRFAADAVRNWNKFLAESKEAKNSSNRKLLWQNYCSTTVKPVEDAFEAYATLRDVAKDLAAKLMNSLQSKTTTYDVGIYSGGLQSGLPGFFRQVCFTLGGYSAKGWEQGTAVNDDDWREMLRNMIPQEKKSALAVGNWKITGDDLRLLRAHVLDQQEAPADKQAAFGVHTDDTPNEGDYRSIITVVVLLTDGQADGLTVYPDGRHAVRCDYNSADGEISMLAFPSALPHATTTTTQATSGQKITFFFGRAWDASTDASGVRSGCKH